MFEVKLEFRRSSTHTWRATYAFQNFRKSQKNHLELEYQKMSNCIGIHNILPIVLILHFLRILFDLRYMIFLILIMLVPKNPE